MYFTKIPTVMWFSKRKLTYVHVYLLNHGNRHHPTTLDFVNLHIYIFDLYAKSITQYSFHQTAAYPTTPIYIFITP